MFVNFYLIMVTCIACVVRQVSIQQLILAPRNLKLWHSVTRPSSSVLRHLSTLYSQFQASGGIQIKPLVTRSYLIFPPYIHDYHGGNRALVASLGFITPTCKIGIPPLHQLHPYHCKITLRIFLAYRTLFQIYFSFIM